MTKLTTSRMGCKLVTHATATGIVEAGRDSVCFDPHRFSPRGSVLAGPHMRVCDSVAHIRTSSFRIGITELLLSVCIFCARRGAFVAGGGCDSRRGGEQILRGVAMSNSEKIGCADAEKVSRECTFQWTVRVSGWVMLDDLPPSAFKIYVTILRHANIRSRLCYVSRKKLSRLCCISVRSIDEHIQTLKAKGLIRRVEANRSTNTYFLPDPIDVYLDVHNIGDNGIIDATPKKEFYTKLKARGVEKEIWGSYRKHERELEAREFEERLASQKKTNTAAQGWRKEK